MTTKVTEAQRSLIQSYLDEARTWLEQQKRRNLHPAARAPLRDEYKAAILAAHRVGIKRITELMRKWMIDIQDLLRWQNEEGVQLLLHENFGIA